MKKIQEFAMVYADFVERNFKPLLIAALFLLLVVVAIGGIRIQSALKEIDSSLFDIQYRMR